MSDRELIGTSELRMSRMTPHNTTNGSDTEMSGASYYPPPPEPDPSLNSLQLYVRLMFEYYFPALYAVAILGNLSCVVVLTDPAFRRQSAAQYLLGIAVVETVLVLAELHRWLEDVGFDTKTFQIGGWCQFTTFVLHSTKFLSTWYTVLLAVDRTVWTCRPHDNKVLCHPWRAKIALVACSVVSIVVYFNTSILYGAKTAGPRIICTTLQSHTIINDRLDKGDAVFNSLIPTLAVFVMCCVINLVVCLRGRPDSKRAVQIETGPDLSVTVRPVNEDTPRGPICNSVLMDDLGFYCVYLVLYLCLSSPHDIYRVYELILGLVTGRDSSNSLRGFLLTQVLKFVKNTKYGVNLLICLSAFPMFRKATGNVYNRCRVFGAGCLKTQMSAGAGGSAPEEV